MNLPAYCKFSALFTSKFGDDCVPLLHILQ